MKRLISILRNYAEDIFILAGLVFINMATFQLSFIAGLYCIGISLIVIGLAIARFTVNQHPP